VCVASRTLWFLLSIKVLRYGRGYQAMADVLSMPDDIESAPRGPRAGSRGGSTRPTARATSSSVVNAAEKREYDAGDPRTSNRSQAFRLAPLAGGGSWFRRTSIATSARRWVEGLAIVEKAAQQVFDLLGRSANQGGRRSGSRSPTDSTACSTRLAGRYRLSRGALEYARRTSGWATRRSRR